jgi:hypothetical protein
MTPCVILHSGLANQINARQNLLQTGDALQIYNLKTYKKESITKQISHFAIM